MTFDWDSHRDIPHQQPEKRNVDLLIVHGTGASSVLSRTPLSMSEICWRSGVPIEGEREGESRPFGGRKGQVFPARESRKGHFGSTEAKGQWFSSHKNIFCVAESEFFRDLKGEVGGRRRNVKCQGGKSKSQMTGPEPRARNSRARITHAKL